LGRGGQQGHVIAGARRDTARSLVGQSAVGEKLVVQTALAEGWEDGASLIGDVGRLTAVMLSFVIAVLTIEAWLAADSVAHDA